MLENEETGFAGVTPQAMLQYLKNRFVEITLKDMRENWESMTKVWNPDQGIDVIWNNIKVQWKQLIQYPKRMPP